MTVDAGDRVVPAPPLAWAFATAFLCLLLPARTGIAVELGLGTAGAAMTVALFVLPLLYTVPRGRALCDRYPWHLLAAQTVLTYLPFLMFGQKWVLGLSGLLGGLVLLTVPRRISWILFVAIVAVEGVLRLGVFGLYPDEGNQFISWVFVVPIDMALPLFGLVRLSTLVDDLRAARTEMAGLAVTQERLRVAARLRTAVGSRLEAVTARATASLTELRSDANQARVHLAQAARIARQAAEQVRQTAADDEGNGVPLTPRRAGNTVAPRLALLVLVVDLGAFAGHHLVIVSDEFTGAPAAAGAAAIVAIAALQLHHSLGTRAGRRPRAWGLTLAVQVLVPLAFIVATFDSQRTSLVGMVGFPAGSVLLLLVGRRAWLAFTVVVASVGLPRILAYPDQADIAVYYMGLVASTGLAVYGLSRLTDLAEELEANRRELARAAVDRERLRTAQDTHDLLGLGLSAVALKCDLAGRLIGRDDARARSELDALLTLARQTHADAQAITTGEHGLSLRVELDTSRTVLATAGVEVDSRLVTLDRALPREVDAVLATVLREAIANVLRHADATRCEIEVIATGDAVTLTVANDGVTGRSPDLMATHERRGRGLANLTARATALGGRLTARADDGRFTLTVRVPLPSAVPSR